MFFRDKLVQFILAQTSGTTSIKFSFLKLTIVHMMYCKIIMIKTLKQKHFIQNTILIEQ